MGSRLVIIGLTLLSATACKIFTPSKGKFISHRHHYQLMFTPLIGKVHNDYWRISYRYDKSCPAKKRSNTQELKKEITKTLQLWLQPVRELKTAKPIVSNFRYTENADLISSDMRITFYCSSDRSRINLHTHEPPDILLRHDDMEADYALRAYLAHEIGHAFGLTDTYVGRVEGSQSTGGIAKTVGKQSASIMSSSFALLAKADGVLLSEDDKRGIVWLYKAIHEGQKTDDCFFSDYVYEQDPPGCRPKYPLLFEIKHGQPLSAIKILDEDPNIDVNAQNTGGSTALHFAVIYKKIGVVRRLLKHPDIKPFLRDKQGRSALDLAHTSNLTTVLKLLEVFDVPRAEDVNGDGVVNILDLVFVAANFEKSGKNIADIDGNGVVNILDLVRVASAFGDTTASAPMRAEIARSFPPTKLSEWLVAARQQASNNPDYQRGLHMLEQLLTHTSPPQTLLLQNYPNPFSHETWLPYRLAKPARVTMSIYDANGRLVRSMERGNLSAGMYQDKSRALYWDGRNTQGEAVASGIYFYTLSAGDFRATRKMVLRR